MPRSVGLDELRGKRLPGVYLINVPKCVKSFYKIGISEEDIEKRLTDYLGYYPWSFYVIAVILFPDDWTKYYKIRDAESELHSFLKDVKVKPFPGQRRTEWFKLKSKKELEKTLMKMQQVAEREGGKFTYFGQTHTIAIPQ